MAGPKRKPAAQGSRKGRWLGHVAIWVGGITLALCGIGLLGDSDDSTAVPPPEAADRADTVTALRKAYAAQGVCYGWQLVDGYGPPVSVGSNLGDNVSVSDDPRCPRWMEITATVDYTDESSASEDSARFEVRASRDLSISGSADDLVRLGYDPDAFIDDPGWMVTQAAAALPLLLAQRGEVEPAPLPTAAPGPPPAALPAAGSDFWRDRWPYLAGGAGLLSVTALLVTIGVVQRRRQLRTPPATRPATASTSAKRKGARR
ncbi:hypothetical protein [Micromonospora sp. NPDC049679]|uniref:hypothetical protein n=1 Tax=Micromonospora sp. NPDC049679 TaxID=3155920 RepID=UPI0033CB970C